MNRTQITTIAYKALLSQPFRRFPLPLEQFKSPDFYLLSYQRYAAVAGVTVEAISAGFRLQDGYFIPSIHGKKLVLFNETSAPSRRRFTIAHELGHAFLQHTDASAPQEAEANFFAAQLLMPDAAIRYLCKGGEQPDARGLQALFGVSATAAALKLAEPPAPNPLDAKVCARFADDLRRKSERFRQLDRQNEQCLRRIEQTRYAE